MILDRDGVLNVLVARTPGGPGEAPLDPAQVRLAAGAVDGLRILRRSGFRIAVATNQPAAAKGEASLEDLQAVQAEVDLRLAAYGVGVDATHVCLHHPAGLPAQPLAVTCGCRKPAPGLLVDALGRLGAARQGSWMVGDSDSDIGAGRAAGLGAILVDSPGGGHKRSGRPAPDARVADLAAAARLVVARHPAGGRPGGCAGREGRN